MSVATAAKARPQEAAAAAAEQPPDETAAPQEAGLMLPLVMRRAAIIAEIELMKTDYLAHAMYLRREAILHYCRYSKPRSMCDSGLNEWMAKCHLPRMTREEERRGIADQSILVKFPEIRGWEGSIDTAFLSDRGLETMRAAVESKIAELRAVVRERLISAGKRADVEQAKTFQVLDEWGLPRPVKTWSAVLELNMTLTGVPDEITEADREKAVKEAEAAAEKIMGKLGGTISGERARATMSISSAVS